VNGPFKKRIGLVVGSRQQVSNMKIFLPNELFEPAIRWYHLALGHIGSSCLWDTMKMHFYNQHLKNRIEDIVSRCDTCQRLKRVGRGHGEVAAREAVLLPWREVAVDLIGPWTLQIGDQEHTFIALTMIDIVTNLFLDDTRVEPFMIYNKAKHRIDVCCLLTSVCIHRRG
jgi:hypothetical protein